jgi:hypothetical protein
MKQLLVLFTVLLVFSSSVFSQKTTVEVQGYFETGGTYGTLNTAIEEAVANGSINNTIFKLKNNEMYVLSRSIYIDHGQSLEIVADKAGTTQETAPPQIVWTEEGIDRNYIIQSYGDVVMKNIWVRYADILGNKVGGSITFENQNDADDPEVGYFDGCLFDYCGIGAESAALFWLKPTTLKVNSRIAIGETIPTTTSVIMDVQFLSHTKVQAGITTKLLFENCTFTTYQEL